MSGIRQQELELSSYAINDPSFLGQGREAVGPGALPFRGPCRKTQTLLQASVIRCQVTFP